jgi:hypothetical protein
VMTPPLTSSTCGIIGVSDHGGWAVLVTVTRAGALLDRRRVELVDEYLPAIPHHHEGQLLPPDEALALVERVRAYRARNVADWVMYRTALAAAAAVRGWSVHWYDAKHALGAASDALHVQSFDAHFRNMRRAVGPPWNQDHGLAMVGAIVAAQALPPNYG